MAKLSASTKNINKPAPRWFRKLKKALGILTIAANAMVASMHTVDEYFKTQMQLWCTIGVGAILEALEAILANGEDYVATNTFEKPAAPKDDSL